MLNIKPIIVYERGGGHQNIISFLPRLRFSMLILYLVLYISANNVFNIESSDATFLLMKRHHWCSSLISTQSVVHTYAPAKPLFDAYLLSVHFSIR